MLDKTEELKDKVEESENKFIEVIGDEISKWNNENSSKIPLIIRREYLRVFSLLKNGQIYGAFFQLKDVFEIILKCNVVVVASEIINKENYTDEEGNLIFKLFEKDLSIGDWESICRTFNGKSKYNSINILSKEINKIYSSNQISKWRNDWIGHGALAISSNEEFIKQIKEKMKILHTFFIKNIEEYKCFDIVCINNECFFEIDNTRIPLKFLIKEIDNNIHIFDAYKNNKNKVAYLDYYNGNKIEIEEKEVIKFVTKLRNESSIRVFKESSITDILMVEEENIIKEINTSKDFIRPEFIKDRIDNFIKDNDSGIMLIKMKRGMGKSTLSMALDNNGMNKLKIDNCCTRTYYINDSYASKLNNFTSTINDMFRVNKEGKILFRGNIPMISSESDNNSQELVKLLSFYREKYYNMYGTEKLLFVIDGIDEINKYDRKTIFDFIPKMNELENGIFIICTCRTDEELIESDFILREVKKINYNSNIFIENKDLNYIELLKTYIKKMNKKYSEEDILNIIDISEYNFNNVRRICNILKEGNIDLSKISAKTISSIDVVNIENKFGEKYYKNIINIISTIIALQEPLSLNEINNLCFSENNDMRLLFYIYSIKDLFKVDRNIYGNRIYIRDVELLKYLEQIYIKQINNKLQEFLQVIYNNIDKKNYEIDSGILCICKNISKIIAKINNEINISNYYEVIKYLNEIINKVNVDIVSNVRDRICIYDEVLFFLEKESNTILKQLTKADILSKQGELYELYGLTNESMEKYKLSLDIFKEYKSGLGFNKIYYDNLIKYELLLYKIERYEEAIQILNDIIYTFKNENDLQKLEVIVTAYCNRSLIYQQIGKIQDAKNDLDKAIELIENNGEIETLKYQISLCYLNRSTLYLVYEEYDNAIVDIKKSLEYSKDAEVKIRVNRARALMNYSNIKIKMGESSESVIDIIDEAINIIEEIDRDDSLFDIDVLVKLYNNKAILLLNDRKHDSYELLSKTIALCETLRKQNRYYYEDELIRAYYLRSEIEENQEKVNKDYKNIIEVFNFNSYTSIQWAFCTLHNLFNNIEEKDEKNKLIDIYYIWISNIKSKNCSVDVELTDIIKNIVICGYSWYKEDSNYNKSIELIKSFLDIHEEVGMDTLEDKAYFMKEIGYCNAMQGNISKALEWYQGSLVIYEKINKTDIIENLDELIILYYNLSMLDIKLENYQNAYNYLIKCCEEINNHISSGKSLNEDLIKNALQRLIWLSYNKDKFGICII
ncbi:tetratricopeptide repeat protein [Clostridium perfringens]|uniref:tetratricopeptide repeat protein n=1 Tax=Clostridium perfringens TaxID=1502 RepID=UPI001899899D|nr:tetratricopeptide repeat protein [Clostridium perfringens]